jgi:class 3 adenylate cyclase/tetratricopeptide (TPR) repeat protein
VEGQRRERKVVTVLFADLVGFTSRAESLDPEDVAGLLTPFQARLRTELERYGGTVEKFIGDAVMAIFGAPVAHEDDPERAVRAALAIRAFADEAGIELRIGINTGEALVQLTADASAGETLATGDVVNTASRLQAAAPTGGILVGARTREATRQAIVYEQAEPVEAKGKSQPVPVWLAQSARSRAQVELVRGAPLVGRRRELDVLVGALERARDERSPQLVTLVGVPGIGKSRLVLELYDTIEDDPDIVAWRQGRCLPYGDGVTFWALGEMVKAQLGVLDTDPVEEAERKLQEAVADPWVAGHLRPLVGLAGEPEAGGDRRGEAFAAWGRFFEELAAERPLVLVFDDLQWADESLLDFVDHVVDWATGVPLLVVCSARPELLSRRPDWGGGKPNATTISLAPLSEAETALLLGELLEQSVLPAETQSALLARAGGNPLYAEQYVRMLRERGTVYELPTPETVQGIIAARLDLLDREQKALLHDAAVVGKSFWLGALAAIGETEPAALELRLHELERKEFVRRERVATVDGEREYSFRHVLVRDVSYGQIPRADRAAKHLRAAEWIESLGRAEDRAEMLAHHYLQALELAGAAGLEVDSFAGRARRALRDAGDRAASLLAAASAAHFYSAALDLTPARDAERGHLLVRLGGALFVLGSGGEPVLEEASELLLAAGDPEGAADAHRLLAETFWLSGDRERATEHLDRARVLVRDLPVSRVKAHVVADASRFAMLASRNGEAMRYAEETLAMADELGLDDLRAAALNNYGTARANEGDLAGLETLREAIVVADAAGSPFEASRARGNLAAQLSAMGDIRGGRELWVEAGDVARRYGQTGFARWFDGLMGALDFGLGDWDAALAECEAFIADIEAGEPHYLSTNNYATRARIRLARDDVEGALADAGRAVELARRAEDPQNLYPGLATAAVVLLEAGDEDGAAALAQEFLGAIRDGSGLGYAVISLHSLAWTLTALGQGAALVEALPAGLERLAGVRAGIAYASGDPVTAADVCAEMGLPTEEAQDRLAAARLLLTQGRRAEADEQLRRALAFYRSVGASRYVREGESLLAASA